MIGQAAEFDYSGTQACRVLDAGGVRGRARQLQPGDDHDRPGGRDHDLRRAAAAGTGRAQVIERERPDALLPTLGGQTALNLAKALHENGVLERYGVELIGANYDAIERGEDRELFRETMNEAGLRVPRRRSPTPSTRRAPRSRRSACR